MKPTHRSSIPLIKARQIITDLRIREPDEIDVELIAHHYGVPVQSKPMQKMDGQIIRVDNRAIITVNSMLQYEPQKRFVIAHELGHYFLHPEARQYDAVSAKQAADWSETQQIEEIEANHFAAELLMPKNIFEPFISNQEPCFKLIKELAITFNNSLTSTAVNFVRTTKEECAIVLSEQRRRKWFVVSPEFSFLLHEDDLIHGHSCAAQLSPSKLHDSCQEMEAGFWLRDFRHDHKSRIVEDAVYSKRYGTTLSLLWIKDLI